jgi:hypothetical protein
MGRLVWCASGVLVLVLAGCGSGREARAIERCRELAPQQNAAAAWDDIDALRERTEEWLRLDCEELIGPAPTTPKKTMPPSRSGTR